MELSTLIEQKTGHYLESENDYWRTAAKNFPELSLTLKEIIDNAISAISIKRSLKNSPDNKIVIEIKELTTEELMSEGFDKIQKRKKDKIIISGYKLEDFNINKQLSFSLDGQDTFYLIEIHDNGIGISDFDEIFRVGKSIHNNVNTFLNEHGVGLKHALAFANIENDAWEILSRDSEDFSNNRYKKVTAPFQRHKKTYNYSIFEGSSWNSKFILETGTVVRFVTDIEILKTIGSTINKGTNTPVREAIKYFIEDIGVTYNKYLEYLINIEFIYKPKHSALGIHIPLLKSNKPCFEYKLRHSKIPLFLKSRNNTTEGEIEIIEGFIQETKDNNYFYKHGKTYPKVYTYLNGRLIGDLWEELFKEKIHDSYNQYYLEINIKIDDKEFIPSTNSSKNQLVSGDTRFKQILFLIKNEVNQPKQYMLNLNENERKQLFIEQLKEKERLGYLTHLSISKEENLNNLGKADAYISYKKNNHNYHELYEFKLGELKLQHIFQLFAYIKFKIWQGQPLNKAILVIDVPLSNDIRGRDMSEFISFLNEDIGDILIEVMTYEDLGIPVKKYYNGGVTNNILI